jgi:hypothetical protein
LELLKRKAYLIHKAKLHLKKKSSYNSHQSEVSGSKGSKQKQKRKQILKQTLVTLLQLEQQIDTEDLRRKMEQDKLTNSSFKSMNSDDIREKVLKKKICHSEMDDSLQEQVREKTQEIIRFDNFLRRRIDLERKAYHDKIIRDIRNIVVQNVRKLKERYRDSEEPNSTNNLTKRERKYLSKFEYKHLKNIENDQEQEKEVSQQLSKLTTSFIERDCD